MELLRMNAGNGQNSYANNSISQKLTIEKTRFVLDQTLQDMFKENNYCFPESMKIVDLGCSSGPNTLLSMNNIIDTINELCKKSHSSANSAPELELFLNDLPHNDFNNLFKLLSTSSKNCVFDNCLIYALPASFYERLFPRNSLHFAYSSFSLHWLSQVPEGLDKENKENIYIARTSPPQVLEAYANQYKRDFSKFLRLRGIEIISGGRMVLTLMSRSFSDHTLHDGCARLTLLAKTLLDMAIEGRLVRDVEDLYSFNLPLYLPCREEVESLVSEEGSFNLDKMEIVHIPWDANDDIDDDDSLSKFDKAGRSGKLVSGCVRAFIEPLLASHFGFESSTTDDLFDRYAKNVAEYMAVEGRPSSYFTITVSLSKKFNEV